MDLIDCQMNLKEGKGIRITHTQVKEKQ